MMCIRCWLPIRPKFETYTWVRVDGVVVPAHPFCEARIEIQKDPLWTPRDPKHAPPITMRSDQ